MHIVLKGNHSQQVNERVKIKRFLIKIVRQEWLIHLQQILASDNVWEKPERLTKGCQIFESHKDALF